MYNPIKLFPNWISVCKIVPLVYDDTLSYYEMLNKFIVKTNEVIETCNTLGVEVDQLKEAVERLNTIVSQFDERITQNENDIADLQNAVNSINSSIDSINGTIETMQIAITNNTNEITNINSSIDSINSNISDMQDTISELSGVTEDISALENDVDSLDTRVTSLEGATFGDITVSPVNSNYSYDMHNLEAVDYSIDTIEGTGSNVTVGINANNCITFHTYESGYIKKQLRLKNFLSNLNAFDNSFGSLQVNLAFCYQLGGLDFNKYVEYANGLTVTQLLTGYTGGTIFTRIKLEASTDNKSYDLIIDCNTTSSAYWIQLEYIFATLGTAVISQATMRQYAGLPTSNLLAIIKKNSGNYDSEIAEINDEISGLSTDIFNLNTNLRTLINGLASDVSDLENNFNVLDNVVDGISSDVNALKTVRSWNTFSDVFENGDFPPGATIHYFHCEKVGKVVTMEVAGRGFTLDANYRFSTFLLGSLRSGVRQYLTPYNNKDVTCIGVTSATTNSNQNIDVVGNSVAEHSPRILEGETLCIGVLTGSDTTNPWTWDSANNRLPAYSLMVNTNGGMQDLQHNAFVFRLVYTSI